MAIPKFSEREEEILKDWKERQIFTKTLQKPSPKGNFVFFDGPPTANGIPHIGHVETRAFKDIIPRFKTMQGYHVERKAGWDTHGLPVEIEVEKALGISGKKDIEQYGIAAFNAKAKESVWKYKDLWEKMTDRVGFWLDTDHPYITYTPEYIESLWWIFKQTWDQDLLVQDYKVVPYCPRCGTALSSHEVAQGYEQVEEPSVYIKFELVDEPGTYVLAWTTTPWTLPGNVALAVDREVAYVQVKAANGDQLILAKALIAKLDEGDRTVMKELTGAELIGKRYVPLFDFVNLEKETGKRAYYIADADFVTTEDGSGVVHTAVMYGVEDFELGQKLDLPKLHTVDLQGRFTALVKPWAGQEVKDPKGETQEQIITYLKDHGVLYKLEHYTHDYPFCWRCKHPLLYYAKTSWFIMMSKLREQLIKNNETITWYPSHIKDGRFGEWLREVKDWAISRERYWGTPIPVWQCDQCKHQECIGSYEELSERVTTRNRYIFVRHGKSQNNELGLVNSDEETSAKYPLTDAGREQIAALAKQLAPEKPTIIYHSALRRTTETADILGQHFKITPQADQRFNEFRTGYDEKPHQEYQAYAATINRFTTAPTDGETWYDLRARTFAALHEIDQRHEHETILIVSHADPILIVEWASRLQSETQLVPRSWVEQGGWKELRLPMQLFQPDGSFDPHRPFIDGVTWPCQNCQRGTMHRIPEVADAWYDSGAMPFAQYHYPFEQREKVENGEAYPANYISEAIDQTRGWFYTLLAISTILQRAKVVNHVSYQHVVVLGHLNDATGRKLSKSLKNYGDLNELFAQHGADALRWFMYTTNQPWDPKNFDTKLVDEGVKKTFLILMNVVSFLKLYTGEVGDPEQATHPLDRWIHSLVNVLTRDVTERLERYDITGAARAISAFVTELSTWYVRRSRDRFKSEQAPLAAAVLRHVLLKLAKVMAPFTPFLAEDVYRAVGGPLESVHLEAWPTVGTVDDRLLTDMATARRVVEQGHALRAKAGIKVRQPLSQVVTTEQLRPDLDAIVRDELNVKELHWSEQLPGNHDWTVGDTVALDTTITDELKEEGLLRDLVREVNALRKSAKLMPTDRIIFHVSPNTVAASIVDRYGQQLLTDIKATGATPSLEGATHTAEIKLDGATVTIGLAKV
ncbi:MAG: class I tRNA ligase family protein [Candidatus Kerfeldbacteria bacterium]|nr:class I tRNA ligase family protein [Candidatus Kerfeldbacteria bacterium]